MHIFPVTSELISSTNRCKSSQTANLELKTAFTLIKFWQIFFFFTGKHWRCLQISIVAWLLDKSSRPKSKLKYLTNVSVLPLYFYGGNNFKQGFFSSFFTLMNHRDLFVMHSDQSLKIMVILFRTRQSTKGHKHFLVNWLSIWLTRNVTSVSTWQY